MAAEPLRAAGAVPPGEPAPEPFVAFGAPVLEEPEIEEVVACLRSGWIGAGPRVEDFERRLEDYLGAAHVRCLSSCSAALSLAMLALGIGAGDEVILPAMTFVASANSVVHTGAKPVFVDSADLAGGLLDLDAAEAAIGPATRALMVVHLAGAPVDMDRVNALRDRHGLIVIEDAAHAIGSSWRGRRIGAHGNPTAYSFYPTKNLTTIEGGAVATADAELAAQVERLARHGLDDGAWRRSGRPSGIHYEVEQPGFKGSMSDVQAAIGIHQLARLDAMIEQRAQQWQRYSELLADLPLELPAAPVPQAGHARHLYRVLARSGMRDALAERLFASGIGTGVHYRAVHLHPFYARLAPERLPLAEEISARTLSLPLGPAVDEPVQRRVAAALRGGLQQR